MGLHAVQAFRHVRGHLVEDDGSLPCHDVVLPIRICRFFEERAFAIADVGHNAEIVRPLPPASRIVRDLPQAIVVILVIILLVKLPVERIFVLVFKWK